MLINGLIKCGRLYSESVTVVIDTEGTNILHYINRSYLFIPVESNTLRENKC